MFGSRVDISDSEIQLLMDKVGRIDSITARMMFQESYETVFKIFDHNHPDASGLSLVVMHPKENTSQYSALYNLMRRFKSQEIKKHWDCSFGEFISYPRDVVENMFALVTEEAIRERAALDRKEAELRELERQGKTK